jgi:diguanylate cyclase (GGDEF)-like protein
LTRSKVVLILAVALGMAAFGVLVQLHGNTDEHRRAQLALERAQTSLNEMQVAALRAHNTVGVDRQVAQEALVSSKRAFSSSVNDLKAQGSPPSELQELAAPLKRSYSTLQRILLPGSTNDGLAPDRLIRSSARSAQEVSALLNAAGAEYHQREQASQTKELIGTAGVVIVLLGAFGFYFHRSRQLQIEREEMLVASRREALTDSLTGLGNRRALMKDLELQIPKARAESELLLALFDLDGFKHYNDSFGHPAGDALLARLGVRLAESVEGVGSAYRMGGDEFCLLAEVKVGARQAVRRAAAALSESGRYFEITCSYGTAVVPGEATTTEGALQLSDLRMYGRKAARGTASRQTTNVLLKVLDERTAGLLDHVHGVATLAELTAREMGLDETEIECIHRAAELHDVGKSAIPDAILNKPGRLNPEEREFICQHTLIGERIVLAAQSLADVAPLIRSSHERVDGGGYPDRLQGEEIPLGSRIIAVCDSYEAMLSKRPYADAVPREDVLAELQHCAGSQFDAEVVRAFSRVLQHGSDKEVAVR